MLVISKKRSDRSCNSQHPEHAGLKVFKIENLLVNLSLPEIAVKLSKEGDGI